LDRRAAQRRAGRCATQAAAALCYRAATRGTDPGVRGVAGQASFRHVFMRSCAAAFVSVSPSSEQGDLHHCQDLVQVTVPAVASTTSLGYHPCSHVGGGSRSCKPYDDSRNAVKEKARFEVPAEGRGVHPAACPVDMDTAIDNAPAADRGAGRRETAS